jgi:pilus assembly protein CpaB
MFLLKTKFILPIAIVVGALASYALFVYLEKQEALLAKPRVEMRPIVVAKQNIPLGTTLREKHLEIREWPTNIIPNGSFQNRETLQDRVVKTEMIAGEAILEAKLAPVGSSGGLAGLIPPGKRAISVAVNVVSGVSGFILPNTSVDVLATVQPSAGDKLKTFTKMVLENVQVLAVDQTIEKEDDEPVTVKSVTLLVSPGEAEKLALASNEGKLQLMLRNAMDIEMTETSGVLLSQLMGRPKPVRRRRIVTKVAPPPKVEEEKAPPPRIVEVIRSNVRSELTFEEKNTDGDKQDKEPTASK